MVGHSYGKYNACQTTEHNCKEYREHEDCGGRAPFFPKMDLLFLILALAGKYASYGMPSATSPVIDGSQ